MPKNKESKSIITEAFKRGAKAYEDGVAIGAGLQNIRKGKFNPQTFGNIYKHGKSLYNNGRGVYNQFRGRGRRNRGGVRFNSGQPRGRGRRNNSVARREWPSVPQRQLQSMGGGRASNRENRIMRGVQTVRISNTEQVATITGNGSGAPVVYHYTLNPSLPTIARWLATVGGSWQNYKLVSFAVNYTTECSFNEAGQVALSCDYNPQYDTALITNVATCLAMPQSVGGDIKKNHVMRLNPQKNRKNNGQLLTRVGELQSGVDVANYDFGNIYIAVETGSTAALGRITIDYTFEFTNVNAVPQNQMSNATSSNVEPEELMANMTENSKTSPVIYEAPDIIYFNQYFKGILMLSFDGTGFGDGFATNFAGSAITVGTTTALLTTIDPYLSIGTVEEQLMLGYIEVQPGGNLQIGPSAGNYDTFASLQVVLSPTTVPLDPDEITSPSLKSKPIAPNNAAKILQPSMSNFFEQMTLFMATMQQTRLTTIDEKQAEMDEPPCILKSDWRKKNLKKHGELTPEKPTIEVPKPIPDSECDENARQGGSFDEHAFLLVLLIIVTAGQIVPPSDTTTSTAGPTTLRPTKSPTNPTAFPTITTYCDELTSTGVGQNNSVPYGKGPYTLYDDCVNKAATITTASGQGLIAFNRPGEYLLVFYITGTDPTCGAEYFVDQLSGSTITQLAFFKVETSTRLVVLEQIQVYDTSTVVNSIVTGGTVATTQFANHLFITMVNKSVQPLAPHKYFAV